MVMLVSDSEKNVYQDAIENYNQKKQLLQNSQALLGASPTLIGLKKNTSNLFRSSDPKSEKNKMDVRNFNQVIYVDSENLIAEIEGMTTYETIVRETLKKNCLPTVVPELKSITIGGALAGVGIESSSFRYGLVHETILEIEILLGDGRIVLCRPDNEHRDLFFAFPNTYGSLGYALKVKVQLIPTKKFVKLSHVKINDPKIYFKYLEDICNRHKKNQNNLDPISYIDGVIFSKNNMVATIGEFVEEAPFCSNYKFFNIFYKSLQTKETDYLTTEDYIWRWDTDWFWCSKHFFMQNKLLRLLFGKWMLKSTCYWKIRNFLNKNRIANWFFVKWYGKTESIIQDVDIPIKDAEQFLNFFEKEIKIKPIWVCPIAPYRSGIQYSFYRMDPQTLYINFGFWDMAPFFQEEGYYNRKIEKMVSDLGGNKSLYSNVYYTPDEFWKIYDNDLYQQLKGVYDPHNRLRNLYAKVRKG